MAAHALAVQEVPARPELTRRARPELGRRAPRLATKVCAACRSKEARYGFRQEQDIDPSSGHGAGRPNTLCFECFRMEIDRRQRVAAQLARGWNAEQVRLPLTDTLKELTIRRRRAQIAARHAIGA